MAPRRGFAGWLEPTDDPQRRARRWVKVLRNTGHQVHGEGGGGGGGGGDPLEEKKGSVVRTVMTTGI